MISGPFSAELEQLVATEMQTGAYGSPQDILVAGVKLLHERRLAYERLKAQVQHSVDQADRGEFLEFDEAGLHQFFDGLKERALRASHQAN
jgi:hypothetical protein